MRFEVDVDVNYGNDVAHSKDLREPPSASWVASAPPAPQLRSDVEHQYLVHDDDDR